ncbi:hypothetical protein Bcep1808_6946 (plasmid) [Burkholderia vietnamiensis G4]|uniref:Uncharacterized protein n=1 Tax=Burkholderia vietnamiensis (strain G4 / LMG 22486) TaxID=269482 RepID=A4JU80_BURVG|nr:hypothetical protein Bcep1808_6946 [Burkholderia vietnamiensis G4]
MINFPTEMRMSKLTVNSDLTYTKDDVERIRRFGDVTDGGVVFDYCLVSANGARFTLIREPQHSDGDIEEAARHLRFHRDAVGKIHIARQE